MADRAEDHRQPDEDSGGTLDHAPSDLRSVDQAPPDIVRGDLLGVDLGDREPPTVPQGLSLRVVGTDRIDLGWNAASDNVGVLGYRIVRNGQPLTTTTGTGHSDTGLAPGTTYNYAVAAYDGAGNDSGLCPAGSATTGLGAEVPDNGIDEDGDGWLGTSRGFRLRAGHPRVLVTPEHLADALARMYGPAARAPYDHWFQLIKDKEDSEQNVDPVNLALIYLATGEDLYRQRFVDRLPNSGIPGLVTLYALDLMYDHVDDGYKYDLMERVASDPDAFYYNSVPESRMTEGVSWGYHRPIGAAPALAYAGVFALTEVEINKDPVLHAFDALNYVDVAAQQLAPDGAFWNIENRVAGDMTYNGALPGTFGGMYDNFGYDSAEDSYGINVVAAFWTLTGQDRNHGFLHDEYRGLFYQNMGVPHWVSHYDRDQYCYRAGSSAHTMARIWYTRADRTQPRNDAVALTAWIYQDPRMQYFVTDGVDREQCGHEFHGMFYDLLFYDDTLVPEPPATNPTATYFSGPGLVSMREDWSDDAAFAVFVAGEGISRRYEDANSFILHRRTDLFPHAGARIRFDADNNKHHWFAIRSVAKNTLKIFDPDECVDLDEHQERGELHSGPPLVPSDNLGGQLFETATSETDLVYITGGGRCRQENLGHAASLYNTADVIKFEHVPGSHTYSVGDGAPAYTRKVDFFEREFLYLRPRTFVIFDRVRSPSASYRKRWVVHSVDRPVADTPPVAQGLGMTTHEDARTVTLAHPRNITTLRALLPRQNRTVIRGGDTLLVADQTLSSGHAIPGEAILESDIPRWLELLASGDDLEGTVTIHGDSAEGSATTETIAFDGVRQYFLTSAPDSVSAAELRDADQSWEVDQWQGFMVSISTSPSQVAMITGNSGDTLFGSFTPGSAWRYQIYKALANSYQHWLRITQVTTADMDAAHFSISVPHYFDTDDVLGRLHTFAPHTDRKSDDTPRNPALGQWTLEIEAALPAKLDHFLNVIALTDPGETVPAATLVDGAGVAGVIVGGRFALFALERSPLTDLQVALPGTTPLDGVVLDLEPERGYQYLWAGDVLTLSRSDIGGTAVTSTPMGVLRLTLP